VSRRPPAKVEAPAPAAVADGKEGEVASRSGGTGGDAEGTGGKSGGLLLDEPLAPEDAARDAEGGGDAGGAPGREETGEEGVGNVVGGGANSVLADGTQVVSVTGPEPAGDAPWMERLREAAGRGPSAVLQLRELWLDAEPDGQGWFGDWLEPTVSRPRKRERAGR